jgi:hypothetical protein
VNSSEVADSNPWALALAASVGSLALSVLVFIWYAWALSLVFQKLGIQGWRAWVPVLNEVELFRLGGQAPWKVLLYFLPVVNLYAVYLHIVSIHRINQRFGRDAGMTVLGVLLAPVWATMLARARVAEPVPLVDRIAPSAPQDEPPAPPISSPAVAAPRAAEPHVVEPHGAASSDILANVEDDAPMPPVPPADPPRPHPGAPYAVRPRSEDEPAEVKEPQERVAGTAPAAASESSNPSLPSNPPLPSNPWSPGTTAATPPPVLRPTPVEITAPPLAPVKDFALPPDAISALAASMIGRDDEEPPAGAPPFITAGPLAQVLDADEFDEAWEGEGVDGDIAERSSAAPSFAGGNFGDDNEDGETVIVDRQPRITWFLHVDGAGEFQLKASRVLLGRKPTSSSPGTQALAIPDSTRTLSKLHARLDLTDGSWVITDLNSTNGVLLVVEDGSEQLIDPGASADVRGRFILGKVGMAIRYEGEVR